MFVYHCVATELQVEKCLEIGFGVLADDFLQFFDDIIESLFVDVSVVHDCHAQ